MAKDELMKDLVAMETERQKGEFKRGELNPEFEKLSHKHNSSINTTKKYYYQYVKDKVSIVDESEKDMYKEVHLFETDQGLLRAVYNEEIDTYYYIFEDVLDYVKDDKHTERISKATRHKIPVAIKGFEETLTGMKKEHIISFLNSLTEYSGNEETTLTAKMLKKILTSGVKKMALNVDDSVQHYLEETDISKSKPKMGDVLKVKVNHIANYGVFVDVLEYEGYKGLLHIKKIRSGFIKDLNQLFKQGDEFEAKVIEADHKESKLGFTTLNLPLPGDIGATKVSVSEEQLQELEKLKHTLNPRTSYTTQPVHTEVTYDVETEEAPSSAIEEKEATTSNEMTSVIEDTPVDPAIIKHLNGLVGALSPKAKDELQHIIDQEGVFKFTLAMTEVAKTFEADLGLHFLREIKKKASDSL